MKHSLIKILLRLEVRQSRKRPHANVQCELAWANSRQAHFANPLPFCTVLDGATIKTPLHVANFLTNAFAISQPSCVAVARAVSSLTTTTGIESPRRINQIATQCTNGDAVRQPIDEMSKWLTPVEYANIHAAPFADASFLLHCWRCDTIGSSVIFSHHMDLCDQAN